VSSLFLNPFIASAALAEDSALGVAWLSGFFSCELAGLGVEQPRTMTTNAVSNVNCFFMWASLENEEVARA
jgi:hypothetical protein